MAIKEQFKETESKNDLEKVLTRTINEMHKLNVPDAEIVHNIKRLMDNLYDEKSTMRRYKDSVFRKLFDDKKELLSLYNALNDSDYTEPELLEITTLDKYWFISVKNDVAFVIMSELYITGRGCHPPLSESIGGGQETLLRRDTIPFSVISLRRMAEMRR